MKKSTPHFTPCPRCNEPRLSHRVCPSCGYYKDRMVVEIKEEENA